MYFPRIFSNTQKLQSSSGIIYISKDARFNEREFPFSRPFPNTTNTIKDLNVYFNLNPILTPLLASNTTSFAYMLVNSTKQCSSFQSMSNNSPFITTKLVNSNNKNHTVTTELVHNTTPTRFKYDSI